MHHGFKSHYLEAYRNEIRQTGLFSEIASGEVFSFFHLIGTDFILKSTLLGNRWVYKINGVGFVPEISVKFDEVLNKSKPDIQVALIFNISLFK